VFIFFSKFAFLQKFQKNMFCSIFLIKNLKCTSSNSPSFFSVSTNRQKKFDGILKFTLLKYHHGRTKRFSAPKLREITFSQVYKVNHPINNKISSTDSPPTGLSIEIEKLNHTQGVFAFLWRKVRRNASTTLQNTE
jgi:hypothetical protein